MRWRRSISLMNRFSETLAALPWASASSSSVTAAVNGYAFEGIQASVTALRRDLAHRQLVSDKRGESVLIGVSPGPLHVVARWAVWQQGGVIVPVFDRSPAVQLCDQLYRTSARLVIADSRHGTLLDVASTAGVPSVRVDATNLVNKTTPGEVADPVQIALDDPAQFLFTSGTTGRPKIVCQTHGNLQAQVRSLTQAWDMTGGDHVLHCLPLHHIHGIVNALECPLWNCARVTMLPRFQADLVWKQFQSDPTLTVFMAVPAMYAKLIEAFELMDSEQQRKAQACCRQFRLMISGSAALHESILRKWEDISGQVLLERYGMTETGMILSNPIHGRRKPGSVGKPMPEVEVKLQPGDRGDELLVKGPGVFPCYWNGDHETRAAFDHDGYFRTGDIVSQDAEGDYSIVGRAQVDILKTAGFKVSCLEIERSILEHPDVADCAVVGLPNVVYGDIIAALIQMKDNSDTSAASLKAWLPTRLPPYKLPRRVRYVSAIPKNAMGKSDKTATRAILMSEYK